MKIVHILVNKLVTFFHPNIKITGRTGLKLIKSIKCDKKSKVYIESSSARKNCHIEAKGGGHIEIGKSTRINYNCIIASHQKIVIGHNVLIGPNVMIYDHDHNYKVKEWEHNFISKDVFIGNNVWIGGNVTILKGTTIGNNCVIAAGTVLKGENIPDDSVVYTKGELVTKKIGDKI